VLDELKKGNERRDHLRRGIGDTFNARIAGNVNDDLTKSTREQVTP
jgi:hypothetical protein